VRSSKEGGTGRGESGGVKGPCGFARVGHSFDFAVRYLGGKGGTAAGGTGGAEAF
jgi:hypothetical protein